MTNLMKTHKNPGILGFPANSYPDHPVVKLGADSPYVLRAARRSVSGALRGKPGDTSESGKAVC